MKTILLCGVLAASVTPACAAGTVRFSTMSTAASVSNASVVNPRGKSGARRAMWAMQWGLKAMTATGPA